MRFFTVALALLAGALVHATPTTEIAARQVGDLQCNVDRLGIVAALATTQGTLKLLGSQLASDSAAAADVQSVESSITGAQDAIGVIAKALLEGQTAPAAARTDVIGNLTNAHSTLAGISASGASGVTLKAALAELAVAQSSGLGVIDNCK
ncbi:hypothetical protein C2E23DRAFT_862557 [Lenzites betulinus]|nr:hypothetical protein C2E23DRAFT_862557 [Lenzites betulinus]